MKYLFLIFAGLAFAQNPPAGAIRIGSTQVQGGTNGDCLNVTSGKVNQQVCGGGVTSITAGTGISINAATGAVTITNSSPGASPAGSLPDIQFNAGGGNLGASTGNLDYWANAVSAPSAPSYSVIGTLGTTHCQYAIAVVTATGLAISAAGTNLATCPDTQDMANFVRIVVPNIAGKTCVVVRTSIGAGDRLTGNYGPGPLADIATDKIHQTVPCNGANFDDIGYPGDYLGGEVSINSTTGTVMAPRVTACVGIDCAGIGEAFGYGAIASGPYTLAIGNSTYATDLYSTAVGPGAKSTGAESTAIGDAAEASGGDSVAVGDGAKASGGGGATALGNAAVADGNQSTMVGQGVAAGGFDDTTMIGNNIIATAAHQASIGSATTTDVWLGGPASSTPVTVHNYANLQTKILRGTSSTISGALTIGTCNTATVTVTGATTAMPVIVTPVSNPDSGSAGLTRWDGYVSSSNTVTVRECGLGVVTPNATAYNVAVIP